MKIRINDTVHDVPEEMKDQRLLPYIREQVGLTGTRYGCGIGLCGACTIHLDGSAVRACQTTVGMAAGKRITTIEGLGRKGAPHPVQKAFLKVQVPQCGFCMSGQIMSVAALLARNPRPSKKSLEAALAGNLCRCGAYSRIREAVLEAAGGGP